MKLIEELATGRAGALGLDLGEELASLGSQGTGGGDGRVRWDWGGGGCQEKEG